MTQSYEAVIRRTENMVSDRKSQRLAAAQGLQVLNLTWEDTARYKGSAVGPNISDRYRVVQNNTGAVTSAGNAMDQNANATPGETNSDRFAAPNPVNRGVFNSPFSGPFADYGKQFEAGVKAYQKLNGDSVAGRKVEVLIRDTGGPSPGTSCRPAAKVRRSAGQSK